MNLLNLINYFVCIIVIISVVKNILFYIFLKDKVYLFFMLFLCFFLSVIITKRVLPVWNPLLFDKAGKILGIINVLMISGVTFHLAKHFLNIETINPFTTGYFLLEIVTGIIFIYFNYLNPNLFFVIANVLVMIYSIWLLAIILYNLVRLWDQTTFRSRLRFFIFISITISLFILLIYNSFAVNAPLLFCSAIFFMIGYMEVEIILKAISSPKMNLPGAIETLPNKSDNEILSMLIDGKLYREISETTGIALNTVKKRISGIYKKYNVKSRAELINKVILKK